ncbi:MAG: cyclase family protein [Chloroflexi bacterium]|nr:cyclase family protein [Chloroflexota bacterium]
MTLLIDLSQPIEHGGLVFPLLPPVQITDIPQKGKAANVKHLSLGDHSGTHIDALSHFNPNGETIEKIPLEYCYGDAVVLDFSYKRSGETISIADVEKAAADASVEIRPGDIVLLRTDAARQIDKPQYFDHVVFVPVDTVRWLVSKGVKVIGLDQSTLDDRERASHLLVKEIEFYHIENLVNLDKIPKSRFKFAGFPLKIVGGSGGPMRAVAIVDDD